jgi:8-oxo-dGTP pyrophosphatase MutT (NUDIX family)
MVKRINIVKALVRYQGKYLLIKKSKDDLFQESIGKWECPGGFIENETPEECVLRETQEETGLNCKIIKELPALRMTDENYDSNCKVYLLEANTDKIKLSEEHTDSIWTEPKKVKDLELALYVSLLLEYFNNPKIYLS